MIIVVKPIKIKLLLTHYLGNNNRQGRGLSRILGGGGGGGGGSCWI